ncbi:hypothetical protein ACFL5J_02645 [Thermodesulfobacteriota bacterium]
MKSISVMERGRRWRARVHRVQPPVSVSTARPLSFAIGSPPPHQIGLADVLALAAMSDELPGAVTLFGIIPQQMGTGLALSAAVQAGMEVLLEMLVDELAGLDVHPITRVTIPA